jgi:hypothetical protein
VGQGPPQSMPSSPLFLIPSVQFPAHGGHSDPPQSIAVSSPSFTLFVQPRSAHSVQLEQSAQVHAASARYAALPTVNGAVQSTSLDGVPATQARIIEHSVEASHAAAAAAQAPSAAHVEHEAQAPPQLPPPVPLPLPVAVPFVEPVVPLAVEPDPPEPSRTYVGTFEQARAASETATTRKSREAWEVTGK